MAIRIIKHTRELAKRERDSKVAGMGEGDVEVTEGGWGGVDFCVGA